MEFTKSVKAYFDCYNSIDVRVAAYKQDDKWIAAIPVIRFRKKSIEEVKEIQKNLVRPEEKVESEKFKIFLDVFESSKWEEIRQNWSKNKIIVEDTEIVVKTNNEMQYDGNNPTSHDHYDFVNTEWDSYYVSTSSNVDVLQVKLKDQNELAVSKNHSDVFEYIGDVLEISQTDARSNGVNKITAPIFFKIEEPIFDGKQFSIIGKGITSKISGVLKIYGTFYNQQVRELKYSLNILNSDFQKKGDSTFNLTKTVSNIKSNDRYVLNITRNGVIIANKSDLMKNCWINQSIITNPLMSILQSMVPFSELKQMLLEPKDKKGKGIKTLTYEQVFERGVGWLLSLLGFQSIQLQEYQQQGSGFERISYDIISSFNNEFVILTHATTSSDLSSQINSAVTTHDLISTQFDNMKIKSVIFTPKPINQTIPENIILIEKTKLNQILSLLENGEVEQARSFFFPDSPGL